MTSHCFLNIFLFLLFSSLFNVDLNTTEISFLNEKNRTESGTDTTINRSDKSNEKGREMIISALFLLGEISMLGFSLEEDEGITQETLKKKNQSNLPSYTISELSKSYKIVLPKKIVLFAQMLMSTHLPATENYENENENSLSLSQSLLKSLDISLNSKKSNSLNITTSSQNNENKNKNENENEKRRECTSIVRAHAFVTIGKICLRDKNMARSHVNIFLRELSHVDKSGTATHCIVLHHI